MKAIDFFFETAKERLNKEHLDEHDYFAILHLVRLVQRLGFGYEIQDGEIFLIE